MSNSQSTEAVGKDRAATLRKAAEPLTALRQLLAVQGCNHMSNAQLARLAGNGEAFFAAVLRARQVLASQPGDQAHE
jgi:hypothetical protein